MNQRVIWSTVLTLVACCVPGTAAAAASGAAPTVEGPPRGPTWHVGEHLVDSFVGWNAPVHLGSVAATALLVTYDIDSGVQKWAASHQEVSFSWALPGLLGGASIPVLLPAGMWLLSDDPDTLQGAAAAAQAVVISFAANTLLKALTGRESPPHEDHADDGRSVEERSRGFRFGFLRGGVFEGWPSGHSMVNMALAASLASYFHDSRGTQIAAWTWAGFVMATVTLGGRGQVHWLADAVAGGAMGWCIGHTVGSGFATNRKSSAVGSTVADRLLLTPMVAGGRTGLRLTLGW